MSLDTVERAALPTEVARVEPPQKRRQRIAIQVSHSAPSRGISLIPLEGRDQRPLCTNKKSLIFRPNLIAIVGARKNTQSEKGNPCCGNRANSTS